MNALNKADALLRDAQAVISNADAQGRQITAAERATIEDVLTTVGHMKTAIERDKLGRGTGGSYLTMTDPNAGVGDGGWSGLARAINLKTGKTRAKVPLESPLRRKAVAGADDVTGYQPVEGPLVQQGYDSRYLYPLMPRQGLGPENLSVQDWRQTSRSVTGDVERDPFSTTEKAELDVAVEHVSEDVRQVAVVISDIPNAILDGSQAMSALVSARDAPAARPGN